MGNNGSSTRDQQATSVCSNGLSVQDGASRGWSQSFPREITRHRSQPTAARKVLPEPPNQRLRATDNGNIIHNGGTISGRRAPTFASSRDLAKRTCNEPPFRERSCSASNLVQPCSRRIDRHCCRYRADDSSRPDANTSSANLKKFGSEPDLRCSPELAYPSIPSRFDPAASNSIDTEETARSSFGCYRYGKETKDRLESGYRTRKKYKAPAPPASVVVSSNLHGGSSPTSESRSSRDLDTRCHPHSHAPSRSHPHSHIHQHRYQVQPPPRRSRLFKTRAESKKAQISWQLSPSFDRDRERTKLSQQRDDASSHWNGAPRSRTSQHSDSEVVADSLSIDRRDRDRSTNVNEHRHHRSSRHSQDHGKNTLQRSMSSPEFQAELIRVARRVRDKLDSSETVLDEATHDRRASRFDTEATISCVDRRPPSRRRNEVEDGGAESRGDSKERDRRGRYEDRSVERRLSGDPVDPASENGDRKNDGGVGRDVIAKSNQRRRTYEGPASKDCSMNDAVGSPKPVEPRRLSQQQNSDPGRRNDHWSRMVSAKRPLDQKWSDVSMTEKSELRSRGNDYVGETSNPVSNERSEGEQDQAFASMTPKTFYFGMNEDSIESRNHQDQDPGGKLESETKLPNRDRGDGGASFIADATDDTDDNERSVVENISLKLRPTLPKKQLEIPRFSPSAAWRLLSTLETPGPSMSTASEEVPVMFEERIERLSRPPPPFPLSLGPRSWHDKSGDSGISGDAGAGNEDSFEVSTINRIKTAVTRPTWTPQQDLGEESSSDAGVDSPPPLSTPLKYHSPRAHVFSLSLPRDEARTTCLCAPETKTREASAFNSLQKLKRSVSGAFGIGSHEHQRNCTRDLLDDNWLLSTSAPTSLQHSRVRIEATRISPSAWRPFPSHRDRDARHVQRSRDSDDDDDDDDDDNDNDNDDDVDDEHDHDHDVDHNTVDDDLPEDEDERIKHDTKIKENDFPVIMKPPSFSYLTPGGHVMYLPEMNETKHRAQNLRGKKAGATDHAGITSCEGNTEEQSGCLVEITPFRLRTSKNAKRNGNDDDNGNEERTEQANDREEEDEEEREEEAEEDDNEHEDEEENKVGNVSKRRCKSNSKNRINDCRDVNQFSTCGESRENVSQPKQRRMFSPSSNDERGPANPWNSKHPSSFDATDGAKPQRKNNSRSRRFTFQSTVRQIERRRLAEKLSREVEAKERQRKGELEAMRKVEEEFQRKRAKEKANIRQQLRLFKEMEENFNSLPTTDWDGSQLSRADPDGAPSSTASSPTSLPIGNSSAITPSKRDSDSTKQPRAERKGYRPKYYDWSPDTSNHLDNHRQTTVHPKVVCDIPKSSPVFVDANVHPSKPPVTSNSTPKSDNYRKDFAHGTVATKTSFASSDSELSQPNTRPHSRQNGIKSKPLRPRSGSPVRSVGAATSEEDLSLPVEPTKRPRNPTRDFILSGVQPFTKQKTYRPISFNPHSPPSIPS